MLILQCIQPVISGRCFWMHKISRETKGDCVCQKRGFVFGGWCTSKLAVLSNTGGPVSNSTAGILVSNHSVLSISSPLYHLQVNKYPLLFYSLIRFVWFRYLGLVNLPLVLFRYLYLLSIFYDIKKQPAVKMYSYICAAMWWPESAVYQYHEVVALNIAQVWVLFCEALAINTAGNSVLWVTSLLRDRG